MVDNNDVKQQEPTPRFNLIDEPWIPIRYPDGRSAELGIRDTLLQAAHIAEIQDASPLVVAAVHRFLLAVLYRALEGPTDGLQARTWFKSGLPTEQIDAYLTRWRERFWLFHERQPFGQVADYVPKKWHAWTKLAAEHNANDTRVLFDHVDVRNAGVIPTAKAARWLLAIQTFALGGGNSDLGYTKHAPSATVVMALPLGRNLADTLLFLLVPQNRFVLAEDIPVWERESESLEALEKGGARAASGYADLYTWRSRSIRLLAEADLSIARIAFASGVDPLTELQTDPMVGYRTDEKRGRLPVIFRERAFWRDFDSLLPDASGDAPQVVVHAIDLGRSVPERFPSTILVVGQSSAKAKIEYWRMETFVCPKAGTDVRTARRTIERLLRTAQAAARDIERGMKSAAKLMVARTSRKLKDDKYVAGKWVPGDASNFIGKRDRDADPAALEVYWAMLEIAFHQVLTYMATEISIDDEDQLICDWLKQVREAVDAAWHQFSESACFANGWTIRALVQAEEESVNACRRWLEREINKFEPQKEPA